MYTEEEMSYAKCKTEVLRKYREYTSVEELMKIMNLPEVILVTLHMAELESGFSASTMQKFSEMAQTFEPPGVIKKQYYNDLIIVRQYNREQLYTKLVETLQNERAHANMQEQFKADEEARRIAALPQAAKPAD
jgi:hypothetical protein